MKRTFPFLLALVASLAFPACLQDRLAPVEHVRMQVHVEDWRDQIIYQLLTDRFANGDAATDYRVVDGALGRYQGGDWQGVIDRLDYLEELGVTALWISPIVLNVDYDAGFDAYHGYWAVDLERLNPHFGDLATLRLLVREAHARDILVIVDIVTNHMGQVFYYDINGNGQPDDTLIGDGVSSPLRRVSEYDPDFDPRTVQGSTSLGESGPAAIRFFDMPEIFRVPPSPAVLRQPWAYHRMGRIVSYDDTLGPDTYCGGPAFFSGEFSGCQTDLGDFPGGLKDLATEVPEVREALIESYVNWVLETDIDGFRIDTLKHVEHSFWREFNTQVRVRLAERGKTNFFQFGEAFDGRDWLLGSYVRPGELDSVFYFSQKFEVFRNVFQQEQPTASIWRLFDQRDDNYSDAPQEGGIGVSPRQALVNFLDNHDVARFLYGDGVTRSTTAQLHAALAYLLTEDGIPCIYYGTEQDYAGGNDPANREPLWWSGYATDGETFQWIARLTRIRREHRALTRGDFQLLAPNDAAGDGDAPSIVAFERETPEGEVAIVVINAHGTPGPVEATADGAPIVTSLAAGTELVDVLSDEGATYTVGAGGSLRISVPAYGTAILIPR